VTDLLDKLPLFATDKEIALAVVGKERAQMWIKSVVPILEQKRGFPRIDTLHGGRPVPLVRKWYNLHLGVDRSYVQTTQEDGKENPDAWRSEREKRNERKPQMGLNSRCLSTLQYMVERPHVRTSLEIAGARDATMEQLAEKDALVEGPRDGQGDRTWTVTDAGREEIARYNDWHKGKRR
jgi:hypothetical protein